MQSLFQGLGDVRAYQASTGKGVAHSAATIGDVCLGFGEQHTHAVGADRVKTLSDIFKLSPDIIEKALNILEKRH